MNITPDVLVFTDGAAKGNPGPGGYGIIMQKYNTNYIKEFSKGYRRTTNNRMELLAVIVALEQLKHPNLKILVFSDSKYVVDAVEKGWVFNWFKKGFKGKKNPDLWKRYLKASKQHTVKFQWIKGHNNHPQNERCDQLAVEASLGQNLTIDHGYENSIT